MLAVSLKDSFIVWLLGAIHKVRTQVGRGGGGNHDKSVRVHTWGVEGGRVKPGEYVCNSNLYFLFFKISSIKRENENN